MRAVAATVLVLALVALAGCGDEEDVRTAVGDVAAAMAARDGEKVCRSLNEDGQRIVSRFQVPPVTCPQTVAALRPEAVAGCRDIEVRDVSLFSSDQAAVRAVAPQGEARVGLLKIDGEWKLRTPPCGPGVLD